MVTPGPAGFQIQPSKLEPSKAAKDRLSKKKKNEESKSQKYDPGTPVTKRFRIEPVRVQDPIGTDVEVVNAEDLAKFPKITRGSVKKRSYWLTLDQVHTFLSDKVVERDKSMLARKVVIILTFVNGLKFNLVRSLNMDDLTLGDDGIVIVNAGKTKIQLDKDCSEIVRRYFDAIYEDTESWTGPLLRIAKYGRFSDIRMGKNTGFAVGSEIAKHLNLEHANSYGIYAPGTEGGESSSKAKR